MTTTDSGKINEKFQIVRITRRMLQGKTDILQGCLLLAPLCMRFDTNENQELITFIVVAEELQRLEQQMGNSINWNEVMPSHNPELAEKLAPILALYRPHVLEACQIAYDKLITPQQRGRYKLVTIAKELLAGDIDFWDGCCYISGGRLDLDKSEWEDPLLLSFVGIASEIEGCPLGEYWRSRCDPAYLAEKDKELEAYRKAIEKNVYEDCREIIRRYDE